MARPSQTSDDFQIKPHGVRGLFSVNPGRLLPSESEGGVAARCRPPVQACPRPGAARSLRAAGRALTFMSAEQQGALQCRQLRLRSGHACSRWCSFSPRRTRPLHAGHSVSTNGQCPSWQLWQRRERGVGGAPVGFWATAPPAVDRSGFVLGARPRGPLRSLHYPCSSAEIRTQIQQAAPRPRDTEGTMRGAAGTGSKRTEGREVMPWGPEREADANAGAHPSRRPG